MTNHIRRKSEVVKIGLDMFLFAERFIWTEEEKKLKITGLSDTNFKNKKISAIKIEAAYWRKANAIHAWFVNNVQKGEDDCGDYYVSEEQLRALLALCKQVKDSQKHELLIGSKSEKLLPSYHGFFFGGTEYGESYFADVDDTIKKLEDIFKWKDFEKWDFIYHSSW